jgi:hypothetical protein
MKSTARRAETVEKAGGLEALVADVETAGHMQ